VTEAAEWSRVRRAQLLLDAHRYEESIAEAAHALEQSPDNLSAQLVLASALLGAGRKLEALRAAEHAVRLGPDSAQAQTIVAQAATSLRRFDRADRAAKEACRLAPHWAWAHYLRMRTLLARGGVAAAREEAAEVLALDPAGSLGHIAQGELALHVHAWAAAEQSFRDALAIAPNNASVLINLGVALSRQGKQAAAIEAYTNAGTLDPTSKLAVQNILVASQRHLMSPALRRTLVGAALRILLLLGSFTVGVWVSESRWAPAAALGAILAVTFAILFATPYRRRRELPVAARNVLALSTPPSAGGQWSRRFRSHPLAGPSLLLVFAVLLGTLGYFDDSDRSSNRSESTEFSGRDLLQPVSTPPAPTEMLRSSAGGFSLRVPTGWTAVDYTSPDVRSEVSPRSAMIPSPTRS
jgi:tetratricopeptide (TPR) repeat protein